MNELRIKNRIDKCELDLIYKLIEALEIDIDSRGLLSYSFMPLSFTEKNNKVITFAIPRKGVSLEEGETYFQPLTNNKHNKILISLFIQQYSEIENIIFETSGIVFLDTEDKVIYKENDTKSPKEGIIYAILNYINDCA